MRRILVLVVAALAAGGCGSGGPTIPKSALPRLVLRESDVGSGYERFEYGRQFAADALFPRADFAQFDRLGGWIARYRARSSSSALLTIESRTDLCNGASGAEEELAAYTRLYRSARGAAHPAVSLGQRSATLAFTQGSATAGVRTIAIAWQEGNAAASVSVEGRASKVTLAAALRLARRQDRLLRAAAR